MGESAVILDGMYRYSVFSDLAPDPHPRTAQNRSDVSYLRTGEIQSVGAPIVGAGGADLDDTDSDRRLSQSFLSGHGLGHGADHQCTYTRFAPCGSISGSCKVIPPPPSVWLHSLTSSRTFYAALGYCVSSYVDFSVCADKTYNFFLTKSNLFCIINKKSCEVSYETDSFPTRYPNRWFLPC